MKILFSIGATREPIDEVRFITNFSTGNTGSFLADCFTAQGHQVTVLAGEGSQHPRTAIELVEYSSFADLDGKFQTLLSGQAFDGIVHLAAVSDYSVGAVEMEEKKFAPSQLQKIDSSGDITLRLKRNHKIVSRLKEYATPLNPWVIAFKLTNSTSYKVQMSAIAKLSGEPGVDFVVHNDLNDIKSGKSNRYKIFQKDRVLRESLDRQMLAAELETILRGSK